MGNDSYSAVGFPPSSQGSMGKLGLGCHSSSFSSHLLSSLWLSGKTGRLWGFFSAVLQGLAAYPHRASVSRE